MTAPVALVEPFVARAGETWTWQRQDLATNYPASAWALKYAFKNADFHFETTAAASGDFFAVTLAATATTGFAAGKYRWAAWVEGGASERYGIGEGWLEVLPAYAQTTQGVLDDRTHARKMLDAIEALLEQRATSDQMEYTIGNRHLKRMSVPDLQRWRDHYRGQVFAEDCKQRRAAGFGAGRIVSKL